MKERKILGIGAVAVVLLVLFAPLLSAMKLSTLDENEFGRSELRGYDLIITVTNCEYDRLLEDEEHVAYKVGYIIENVGGEMFPGGQIECKMDMNDISRQWSVDVKELAPGENYPYSKEISLFSSVDDNSDQEKYLAGETFSLNIETGDDTTSIGHFGWEAPDYKPTCTQIKKTAKQLAEMAGSGKMRDGIYTSLKDRLGYVYDLGENTANVMDKFYILLTKAMQWGVDITEEMQTIEDWINNGLDFLIYIIGNLLDYSLQKIPDILDTLDYIQEKLVGQPPDLIEAWENFNEAVQNYCNWLYEKHWENDIDGVSGGFLNTGKEIHVWCREQEDYFKNSYYFVNLDPTYDSEKSWQMHDCTIRFEGPSGNIQKSPYVLSWAFSEGSFKYDTHIKPRSRLQSFGLFELLNSLLSRLFERYLIKPLFIS